MSGTVSDPLVERLAVIRCGDRQGSGYLLAPRLVLTAAHVVTGDEPVLITTSGQHATRCTRIVSPGHRQEHLAAAESVPEEVGPAGLALLALDEPVTAAHHFLGWSGNRWALLRSLAPIPRCHAIGFPYVQRSTGGRIGSEQILGTYHPGSGLATGQGVLVVSGTPPEPRSDGISPWAGMSGAAVFAGNALLGVVDAVPRGWRNGRLTVTPVYRLLEASGLSDVLDSYGFTTPHIVPPPGQLTEEAARFEPRYTAYMSKKHGTLRIVGIDFADRKRAAWPLDAAYYSLDAAPTARHTADGRPAEQGWKASALRSGGPLPAEQALAGHDQVLLRGVAGSGKTTLVQWLAVATARQDLGEHLSHLRDLVPYVLPLRTIARRDRLPAPAEFLSAVEAPLTAPTGWAEEVLTERRALVLVDGLDEVDEQVRERVGEWLRSLLAAFPGNRWLVTSRPSAVADSWLADEGFTELTLAPMSRSDVRAFTERWHAAAHATTPDDDPEERARLDGYQRTLLDALQAKPDLARLATNPLMCGLICALHRDREGYLPTDRKELYDAALTMLLIRRDREREMATPLAERPQIQLLQKLAYWLVKNGQAEMDVTDVLSLITAALPAMPKVATDLGDSAAVYRYLRDRSGLLREPTTSTVDFIHRTFQDYLAARAAVEELDFPLLTANAHHDQWADVIRLAVAHARPAERARLLGKLIARGDAEPENCARLHLLAMACLEHATELDPEVRAAVEERAARLIPPRDQAEVEALVSIGPLVLELLPGPQGLSVEEAKSVILTARYIGVDASVSVLSKYADHPSETIRDALAGFDRGIDQDLYIAEVLSRLPRDETVFSGDTEEDLASLARLDGIRRLLTHLAPSTALNEALQAFPALERLVLAQEQPASRLDLTYLVGLPSLAHVDVYGATKVFNAHKLPHVRIAYH
ncbi:NACHT domain-containing protein [Actinacidiphila alni]|uniref:NACHT domain-containing protein n=1 Tax=Actinacidiphila alni TaxID=380248 RepID=UPI0033D238E6